MQTTLVNSELDYKITEELFQAYFDCRKNKRNNLNSLLFEKHLEHNLFRLEEELISGTYYPQRSIAFIVKKPVQREIFAADFKDRVVHHFLINKLNPFFESVFIRDSFACRKGKGTHYGVKRVNEFIKNCSTNYTTDCYVLKLDVLGFFMHINRSILFNKMRTFILRHYKKADQWLVLELSHKIIFNNPTKNCILKGTKKDWEGLPKNKSLFHSPPMCGLPIGNLTSQVFANFYLNSLDHFIKNELGVSFYGRYVDDFVLVHPNKEYLQSIQHRILYFLHTKLELSLHPKKIYLQHFSKGVQFLGTVIKPNRIYISNRTKGNFYTAIQKQNEIVRQRKPSDEEQAVFLSSMNSYLGILKHYKTYNLRKRMIFKNLSACWWNYVYLGGEMGRFVIKNKK